MRVGSREVLVLEGGDGEEDGLGIVGGGLKRGERRRGGCALGGEAGGNC